VIEVLSQYWHHQLCHSKDVVSKHMHISIKLPSVIENHALILEPKSFELGTNWLLFDVLNNIDCEGELWNLTICCMSCVRIASINVKFTITGCGWAEPSVLLVLLYYFSLCIFYWNNFSEGYCYFNLVNISQVTFNFLQVFYHSSWNESGLFVNCWYTLSHCIGPGCTFTT